MTEQDDNIACKRCGSKMSGEFCSDCGNARTLRKIDGAYLLSEIASVFNFDKGILLSIRELLLRPGKNIQTFILEDRARLVKPIVFIIVCSLSYTLFQQLLGFEDGYINYSFDGDDTSSLIFEWISKNYGYANILISIFIAFWIKVLFRKDNYNFFEILILLCFLIGMSMLIFSFFGILASLTGLSLIDKGSLIGLLYIAWGIGQFFSGNKIKNSLKGLLTYILGLLTFTLSLIILGKLVDGIIA